MTTHPVSGISRQDGTPGWQRDLAWLLPCLVVFFFLLLGSRPLSNPDEGRYTEIPREMAESGDYVTPRLNGVKYFEKPPLIYWLSALTFEVAGVSEWSSRFWVCLLAVAGALITYAGGRMAYGRDTGVAAAVVLSTSLLYYTLSRVVLLDLAVGVFVAGALFCFLAATTEPAGRRRRLLWYGFYVGMALATLTKGLIGIVLPGAVSFFWVLLLNRWRTLRPFYPWSGTLLLLVIAAPWHVLASLRNPDFAHFYFVHEHFERFFTTAHDRYQPFWYFVPVLLAGFFPWTLFLFPALKRSLVGGWKGRNEQATGWFLFLWFAVIFLFFSKSQSKLIPYIVPVFPPLAIMVGRLLIETWQGLRSGAVTWGFRGYAFLAGLLGMALLVYPIKHATPEMLAALKPFRISLAIALFLSGVGALWALRMRRPRAALIFLVGGVAVLLIGLNPVGRWLDTRSGKVLAEAILPSIQPNDTLYSVGEYFQDMPVYLARRIPVVDYQGELAFGIAAEPEQAKDRFFGRDEFLRRWEGEGRAYAMFRSDVFDKWFSQQPGASYNLVARTRRFVLVSKHPLSP